MEEEIEGWTARRKVALALEVIQARLTLDEACRKYGLAPAEIVNWVDAIRSGIENAMGDGADEVREQLRDQIWIRNLLDASDEVIYFKDLQSRFIRVSLGMAELHGLSQDAMRQLTDADLYAEAHAAAALADEQEIIRTGVPIVNKEECESFADRPQRWVATSKFPLRDPEGGIIGTFGISRDITRRVLAEQEAKRQAERSAAANAELGRVEAQLRSVLNGSADAIAHYTPDLRYRYINAAGERLRARPFAELVGRTDRETGLDPADVDAWEAALLLVLATAKSGQHEFCNVGPDGRKTWFHSTLSPETDAAGAVIGVLASSRDITTGKMAELALAHQATHDPVTGLANRYLLMDRLGHALLRLGRLPGRVMLMFVDLDHFKAVNDLYGHETGDTVLVEVGRRLSHLGRREDTVARLGGDEFVALCENVQNQDSVREIAGRMVAALARPFDVGRGLQVCLSASVGVGVTTDAAVGAADLLREADTAMYRVKQQGRNGFHIFDPLVDPPAGDRL
ncbi:MAG: diguanylate cyclase [Pseudoxanthomonas sp.]